VSALNTYRGIHLFSVIAGPCPGDLV
jgi:hypothetical protein